MNKQEIDAKLIENHRKFADYIANLSDEDFTFSNGEKWTAGQQCDHICLSIKPLLKGLSLPKIAIAAMFGKAERDSMSYDDLVAKYQSVLASGGKSTARFLPAAINANQKETMPKSLLKLIGSLTKKIGKFSESDLDKYQIPHPLLGKLTLREMLCFMIYHVEHHHKAALRNLDLKAT
jgi:uncharacterized damage-inducible protein DinB